MGPIDGKVGAVTPVMPAWVLGAIFIGLDVLRAFTGNTDNVAWQAHLGGVAFAYVYARFGWQFSRFLPAAGRWSWKWPKVGTRLKIHRGDEDTSELDAEGDRILGKLMREGEQSLTHRERRALEKYSRRMREKRGR